MVGTGKGRAPGGVLAILALLLVVAGVVAAAVVVLSGQLPSAAGPWLSPFSAVKRGAIDPAIALKSLAGQNDQDVLDQALAAGSRETAFATLLYSSSLSDQSRTAGLLAVAGQMARAVEASRALPAVRTAVLVAMLSPTMPDHARAAGLDQAGQTLATMGKTAEAARAYEAAATIALHSSRLETSYRRLLLEGLAADFSRLGRGDRARELRAAAQADAPTGDSSPYVLPTLLVPLVPGDSPSWAGLEAVTARRIELAAALIATLEGNSPTPSETVRRSLEESLVSEDRLREQLFTDGLSQTANLMERVAFAKSWMEWQALKWRVADQGFGVALVPAWERNAEEIAGSLQKACEDYYVILRDVAISLPDQLEAAQGAIDIIANQITLDRLGLYPNAREAELLQALDKATRERVTLRSDDSLYVAVRKERDGQVFVLVPAAELIP